MAREKLTLRWRGKSDPVPDITFVDVTAPTKPAPVRAPHVVTVSPFEELTGLQVCLNHWREWMQNDDKDLGARVQKLSGGSSEDREGYDDDAGAATEMRRICQIAQATDAMIDSLDRLHKAAIYRSCGIASVWRFPNMDFGAVLPEAERELTEKLARNVATRAFF